MNTPETSFGDNPFAHGPTHAELRAHFRAGNIAALVESRDRCADIQKAAHADSLMAARSAAGPAARYAAHAVFRQATVLLHSAIALMERLFVAQQRVEAAEAKAADQADKASRKAARTQIDRDLRRAIETHPDQAARGQMLYLLNTSLGAGLDAEIDNSSVAAVTARLRRHIGLPPETPAETLAYVTIHGVDRPPASPAPMPHPTTTGGVTATCNVCPPA